MTKNEKEIWKSHPEYAGVEASTFGRVRTLDRVVPNGNGTRLVKGHVLKQCDNGSGYLRVRFSINGKQIKKSVHRLVAQAFITNPDNLPEVNHRDCNRKNNNVENLEFCTHEENTAYRDKLGHTARNNAPKSPVFAIKLSTLKVSRFNSQREASRTLGFSQGSINGVIIGKLNKTHGYFFVNDDGHADDTISRKLQEIKKIYS